MRARSGLDTPGFVRQTPADASPLDVVAPGGPQLGRRRLRRGNRCTAEGVNVGLGCHRVRLQRQSEIFLDARTPRFCLPRGRSIPGTSCKIDGSPDVYIGNQAGVRFIGIQCDGEHQHGSVVELKSGVAKSVWVGATDRPRCFLAWGVFRCQVAHNLTGVYMQAGSKEKAVSNLQAAVTATSSGGTAP